MYYYLENARVHIINVLNIKILGVFGKFARSLMPAPLRRGQIRVIKKHKKSALIEGRFFYLSNQ